MVKKKYASTDIISGSGKYTTVNKKTVDGRQETVIGGRKRKRLNANRYKSLFTPQRIRIELDADKEPKVQNNIRVRENHDEAQKALLNADNDNRIIHTSSLRHDIENQQERDPCDKNSKFVEFWVPVQLSNVQLEQYCANLISNKLVLCCGSKDTGGPLHDVFISNRKCCNHPYVVDPTLHSKILKVQEPTMLKLDADIKASGKLQFLDLILPELKKRQLRVLILFQSKTGTKPTVADMLFDFVHQRFGEDSYECLLTGLEPSKRKDALTKFNNDTRIPFFLLEHRACHYSNIKLSSIDIIVIFDSHLNPTTDLKTLQKISIDSQSDQIMIFRLYTSSTLEERILKHFMSNDKSNVRIRYDALLTWGAVDLFDRLTEFHRGSVLSISSEESLLKNVVEEFLFLICNKCESNDEYKSKSMMITRVQTFGIYDVINETKTRLPDPGDQPRIFWKRLFDGRLLKWKFVSISTPRKRKPPRDLYCTNVGPTNTEEDGGGGVRLRRKTVKPVIEEGETRNINEGGSRVGARNEPQSSPSDRFQSTTVGNEKSLHDLLKTSMSELSNVLKLSDDVRMTVEKFLEFVIENYHMSSEHTSTLQALMVSMCWIGSAIQNIKIDRIESFDIAKKHLNLICQLEEAYKVYAMLLPAKDAFLLQTDKPSPQRAKIDTEKSQRAIIDTEKSQYSELYREEINKFNREWEEQRVILEKNYRIDQARVRSMHSNLSVRSQKLTQLKENYVNKLEEHGKIKEVYFKELEARQVAANDEHTSHGPSDTSSQVGPSHDEHVVSSGPIEEVLTPNDDDVENDGVREFNSPVVESQNKDGSNDDDVAHVESPKTGTPAGNCNNEKAADGGEERRDLCSSSNSTIRENENQDKESNSLVEINDEERSFLDGGQLGQILLEALSLDPPIAENQSDMMLEPISEHIPEGPTPLVNEETESSNTLSLALDISENVNQLGPLTPNYANPLQAEEERIHVEIDDVIKLHEETKETLNSDCEREIEKMVAQIKLKYETKCREQEAAFQLKHKEINANVERALMNKQLAAAFRSKCQDLTLYSDAGKQHGSQIGLMNRTRSLPPRSTLLSTSPPPPMPLALQSQPPLQIVHRPSDLFSTTNCRITTSTTSTTSRPPPVINTITPSTTSTTSRPPPVIEGITPSRTSTTSIPSPVIEGITPSTTSRPPPVIEGITPSTTSTTSILPPVIKGITPSTTSTTSRPPPVIEGITPSTTSTTSRPPPFTEGITPSSISTTSRPPPVIEGINPSSTSTTSILTPVIKGNTPSTTSTTSRPPPVIKEITPSSTANSMSAANQQINNETLNQVSRIRPSVKTGEVRAPTPQLQPRASAPHFGTVRPTLYVPPGFAAKPRVPPAQHVTSTPLTSPLNPQSIVLPPLPKSSTKPLPQPPKPNVVLPPPPPPPPLPPPPPESSRQPPPPVPPEPKFLPPPPLSGSSAQPLPPIPTKPCVVLPPQSQPPPPPGFSLQPLPLLPSEPYVKPPPPPPTPVPSGSSPQMLPPLPNQPYFVPPPPPPTPVPSGSSPQLLPPLPNQPYFVPPPPPPPPNILSTLTSLRTIIDIN